MVASLTFLKATRLATKHVVTKAEFVKITNKLKTAKDVNIPGFNSAIANVQFKHVNGGIRVNDIPFRSVEKHLRAGNLRKFFDAIGVKHKITAADEIAFKQINPHLPEIKLSKLQDEINRLKQQHPDLDIVAKEGMNLENVLTPKAKSMISKFWSVLEKRLLKYTGLIGGVILGKNMYAALMEATLNRNGCFLLQHINGKTIACKVVSKSCLSPNTKGSKPPCTGGKGAHINIALLLLYSLKTDNTLKMELEGKLKSSITEETIPVLLSNVESKTILLQYIKENDIKIPNPCSYNDSNERNCVACDSSVDNSSIEYVDSSDLPDNMSYLCKQDSTILETMADYTMENALNFFEGIVSFGSGLFKYVAMIGSVLSVIVLVFFIIMRYFNKENSIYCGENCMRNINTAKLTSVQ